MRALVTGGAKRLGHESQHTWQVADTIWLYIITIRQALDVTKEINSLGRISECLKCDLLVEDEVRN